MSWLYYAVFQSGFSTQKNPLKLVRRDPSSHEWLAESLSRQGTWIPNTIFSSQYFGHELEKKVELISERDASEIVADWVTRGVIPFAPGDAPRA